VTTQIDLAAWREQLTHLRHAIAAVLDRPETTQAGIFHALSALSIGREYDRAGILVHNDSHESSVLMLRDDTVATK